MVEIPIWRFGYRWEILKDYDFAPEGNVALPQPAAPSVRERRADQGADLVLYTLIPAIGIVIIALFKNLDLSNLSWDLFSSPENFSKLCYVLMILAYAIYLSVYYRAIWNPYYSLYEEKYNDRRSFLFYAFILMIFSIGAMSFRALLWPLYVFILFFYLYLIKSRTQRLFRDAVDDYLNVAAKIGDVDEFIKDRNANVRPLWIKQLLSARALSISFTVNFVVWGLIFGGMSIAALAFAALKPTIATESTHQIVSLGLVLIVVVFFLIKTAGGGIKRIKRQLEAGEWEGFTLFRRPWS